MAEKSSKTLGKRNRQVANFISILLVLVLGSVFILETRQAGGTINDGFAGLIILLTLVILIAMIRNAINYYKLAFNVPFILLIFYTSLMMFSHWNSSYYFVVCLALCAISCIYSGFYRSVTYIIVQNLVIGFLIFRGAPLLGHDATLIAVLVTWGINIVAEIILLFLTRAATISLNEALEHQNSFRDLLSTTENYVAMVDSRNEVVYASKALSMLSDIEEPALVQGRPLIDLFPGRSLKLYAGNMLKEKDSYAEDWEFSLQGQKRYFKAVSHSLPGGSGGTLISLYDMTHLAERDEIAVMKDSMQIGLFFMDRNFVIQDHYSRYLEVMLSENDLFGKLFTDIISKSVTPNELEAIKDYFGMVMERSYDQEMLDDINPLNELHYVNARTGEKKVFQCAFATVERDRGEVFLLVTVYDITTRVELAQRLAEEETKRQEEMQSVFELIQVEPDVFSDFTEDMEYEFGNIDKVLKTHSLTTHEALVKVYQSVHAIKSNAVILGLSIFGGKVHNLESRIKKLREMEGEVPFSDMLNLAMDIEKISEERETFKVIIGKLQSYSRGSSKETGGERQNVKVMIESLAKTASRAAADIEKKIRFSSSEVEPEAIDKGPRRVMKEILMQLIRNSVVHGIESPAERKAKGKNETGIIKLSIKLVNNQIQMKLTDDGRGLDYKKISKKALASKLIKKEDAGNKDVLLKAIFAPGFSTADDAEGMHAGRGIGLNLVRDRVKEVNGAIKLRSETDKGIVFFVTIPVAGQKPAK
ncbi:MAG: hypothetical protein LBH16_04410 [Treponema sp.]|jgi:two-component system chemotaxis sensor kinase CheA|nr:hypothetical protein [Treponema sp.]